MPKKQELVSTLKKPSGRKATAGLELGSALEFPIVGIGASAGGLEAMEAFFRNVPAEPPMAFVVVQHLDPKQKGYLMELLQPSTPMQVLQARDRQEVEAGKVYVIPPNKDLALQNGTLRLSAPTAKSGLRLPIDLFLRSLAQERAERSIGIILSGMGSDGCQGLLAIEEANGIVMLQDPGSAKFSGMPSSSAEAVPTAIVGTAGELPAKLIKRLKEGSSVDQALVYDTVLSGGSLDKIISILREHTGHDFSDYKKNTLIRRIERRKGIHQIGETKKYVRFLQENASEADILFNELLIGVTNFFRDGTVWETLAEKILPERMARLPNGYAMRMWVPACSTGEEAYSLAIVFQECLSSLEPAKNIMLQIFATDIDSAAIEKARRGFFPDSISKDVSKERLERFFEKEGDGYAVKASVRERVVFAVQNVIKDPPFTKLDLLSCRNMLIYMETELQQKLISLFRYSIRPQGIMILGTSESLGASAESFVECDEKAKIFQPSDRTGLADLVNFPSSFSRSPSDGPKSDIPVKSIDNIQALADQVILQNFAPPSVLVNSKGDIVYVGGRTGKYLEPAAGKANWNVYAMARKGLREILPRAFRSVLESSDKVVFTGLPIKTDSGIHVVDVTLKRIDSPPCLQGMVLIVFMDVAAQPSQRKVKSKTISSDQTELAAELQKSYDELQSMRKEMQTSQEELGSTNEELQSTIEELQSANEELTTSKEEMQSLNEELQTVNAELQSKVSEYVRANDDMNNLLNSTEIATLFLDRDLHVRRFTDQITKVFKLREVDIGRPFTELVTALDYPDIDTDARTVLKTLRFMEQQVATHDDRWFMVRIMPYLTLNNDTDGLVLTFNDISVAKKLEIELTKANKALNARQDINRYSG